MEEKLIEAAREIHKECMSHTEGCHDCPFMVKEGTCGIVGIPEYWTLRPKDGETK